MYHSLIKLRSSLQAGLMGLMVTKATNPTEQKTNVQLLMWLFEMV